MPERPIAVTAADVPPRARASGYPADLAAKVAGREKRVLGDLRHLHWFTPKIWVIVRLTGCIRIGTLPSLKLPLRYRSRSKHNGGVLIGADRDPTDSPILIADAVQYGRF